MPDSCKDFEDILNLVGGFGRWHVLQLLWALLIFGQSAAHTMSSIFIASVPEHHCSLPEGGEPEEWLPIDEATGNFSSCYILAARGSNVSLPCSSYVYLMDKESSSVVSDWDLVCSNRWMVATVQASHMFGVLCAGPLWGMFSDQFGRKWVLTVCGLIYIFSSISSAFSKDYAMFITLRVITVVVDAGLYSCITVLYIEIIGTKWRAMISSLCMLPYPLGLVIIPGIDYLKGDWRFLQLAISVPSVLMLAFWWVLPESPRWLIVQGRLEEALDVLKSAASWNRRQLPSDQQMMEKMAGFHASNVGEGEIEKKSLMASCYGSFCKTAGLVRTPKMRRNVLASMYVWPVSSMVFYGVSFETANLSNSPHLVVLLGGVALLLSLIVNSQLMQRLGGRIVVFSTFLMSGIAMICVLAVPKSLAWPKILLGTFGKFTSGATYFALLIYTAEFLPTDLRTSGIGILFTFGMLGLISAPYIADLLRLVHWAIPSSVFGVAAMTGVAGTLLLPETVGRRMPETVEDVEECGLKLEEPAGNTMQKY